ncbi:Activating signal cointegrator 1 complex subunit 2 [Dufourea novaeangliae]|uniref:Activating signal cointegrator 1 complex subunit 2 n=1 Tax=Dufourea novaeangliae TaxID=178035 RepID=A0A154P9Y0_DUFNO|nr:Activating signal cointegrator 1 complex subunit 2 [Dufourea novaeangliae]
MEVCNYMINDLKWLLSLPFFRFWSNIVYNTSIVDALVSFLQGAPPFYDLEYFPKYPEMLELLETLSYYVLVVFTRLITNKDSPGEYMGKKFLGNLLYEKYIFTIPIIFDLCQLYGRENEQVVKKILTCLFALEPQYNNDLQKVVPCLIQALENVETKFGHCSVHNTGEAVLLSKQDTGSKKLTLFTLQDLIIYVLDTSSTITVFLKNYPLAVSMFQREDFMNKIVSIYENVIPEMYKNLDKVRRNDDDMPEYIEIKHRLDVSRIEILNLNTVSEGEVKEQVEKYLIFLTNAISEKEFITDYDQFYPVTSDLETLTSICPEVVDTVKCDYISRSIRAITGKSIVPYTASSNQTDEAVAGPSGVQSQLPISTINIHSQNQKKPMTKHSDELACKISEIKDLFNDLDEQFIEMCLRYYDNDTVAVVNAVLEKTLHPELKELQDLKAVINNPPPDYMEVSANEDIETLNLFKDNDDHVRVKNHKVIEVSKDYMLKNYDLVPDEYDDEYDDTYDDHDIRGAENNSVEIDSRPFTTPRILREKQNIETVNEIESEDDDDAGPEQNGRDCFIPNPAELRAKANQRMETVRGRRGSTNVIGKPKGQGQEKNVMYSRQEKNAHKATRGNHNRRSGANWKRNQGMFPA